jgi:TIR domain-containing protein
MKVFISWHGDISREIANALHDWLPHVIQSAKPFVSSGDIGTGRRWSEALATELSQAAYGIVCITSDNYSAPWINFEAGAISKSVNRSYLSPLLFNVEPADIEGPLKDFQSAICSEKDILELVRSINAAIDPKDQQLPPDVLNDEFYVWWPKLRKKLDKLKSLDTAHSRTPFKWLCTSDNLSKIQSTPECKRLQIVSPDLNLNVFNPPLINAIKDRLAADQQVEYSFLIPKTNNEAENNLGWLLGADPARVKVLAIESARFHPLAVTDYFILDPYAPGSHAPGSLPQPQVFLELPVVGAKYWIKASDTAASEFAKRFYDLAHTTRS